jgi:hypothetical protein
MSHPDPASTFRILIHEPILNPDADLWPDLASILSRCVLEGWHALSTNPGGFRNAEIAVVVAVVGRVLKEKHNDGQDARGWQHTWLGKAVSGCARVDFRGISDREKFDDAIGGIVNADCDE